MSRWTKRNTVLSGVVAVNLMVSVMSARQLKSSCGITYLQKERRWAPEEVWQVEDPSRPGESVWFPAVYRKTHFDCRNEGVDTISTVQRRQALGHIHAQGI